LDAKCRLVQVASQTGPEKVGNVIAMVRRIVAEIVSSPIPGAVPSYRVIDIDAGGHARVPCRYGGCSPLVEAPEATVPAGYSRP
jgi:hypothetical protein